MATAGFSFPSHGFEPAVLAEASLGIDLVADSAYLWPRLAIVLAPALLVVGQLKTVTGITKSADLEAAFIQREVLSLQTRHVGGRCRAQQAEQPAAFAFRNPKCRRIDLLDPEGDDQDRPTAHVRHG